VPGLEPPQSRRVTTRTSPSLRRRCSVTPSHRPKYFNHKIILASIEPRAGTRCAR
jgi:hypothetical protein